MAHTDADVTASDNDKRALKLLSRIQFKFRVAGSYYYKWRVEDQSGNYTIVERTINVVDTTAPSVTLLGSNPYTVEAADGQNIY